MKDFKIGYIVGFHDDYIHVAVDFDLDTPGAKGANQTYTFEINELENVFL